MELKKTKEEERQELIQLEDDFIKKLSEWGQTKIIGEDGNRILSSEYIEEGWKALTASERYSFYNLQCLGDMQSFLWKIDALMKLVPPKRATYLSIIRKNIDNYFDALIKEQKDKVKAANTPEQKAFEEDEMKYLTQQIEMSAALSSTFNHLRPFIMNEDEDYFNRFLRIMTIMLNESGKSERKLLREAEAQNLISNDGGTGNQDNPAPSPLPEPVAGKATTKRSKKKD